MQVLQAIAAWQQSLFAGVQAVHAETQTAQPEEVDRGTKRKPEEEPRRRWILLHGVSEAAMEAQMTDSMKAAMDGRDDADTPAADSP